MENYKNQILNIFSSGNQFLNYAQYRQFDNISNDVDYAWNNWEDSITSTYYEGEKPSKAPIAFIQNWLENEDFEADGYDVEFLKELFG